ncbi:MAG: outer membrane beta-barrel protein [Bacteroidota bacterium]
MKTFVKISSLLLVLSNLSAQGVIITNKERPYLYLSSAYVSSSNYNHGTVDPFYSPGTELIPDQTVRADLGFHLNKNVSIEVGYMRMPLAILYKLAIEGQSISNRSLSRSRISFYSLRLHHGISLYKNRILLKTGIGYAIGNSTGTMNQLGPTAPKTSETFGNTITESRTTRRLANGNGDFLTLNLGIEFVVFKKLSLFANYSLYHGFQDYEEVTIDYTINGSRGRFTTTSDGSFRGHELGLKFHFR